MDSSKIKNFWNAQADKVLHLSVEGIANLEEDPALLQLKVDHEKKKIMDSLDLPEKSRILDLGSGTGQWALRFAEKGWQVVGVEYAEKMINLAKAKLLQGGWLNVEWHNMPAQDYISDHPFDLIFISGLLIYLTDAECRQLAYNCAGNAIFGTQLILRDGTGITDRYEINDRYSKELKANYSATYRTAQQYISLFEKYGFRLISDQDMFEKGSPLNKRKETRLRLYCFEKKGD